MRLVAVLLLLSSSAFGSIAVDPVKDGVAKDVTLTNGTQKTQRVDGAGAVIGPALNELGINYSPVYTAPALYTHIATNATTVVKSGTGMLSSICFNSFIVPLLGTATTATVYDNTAGSGTVIAVISGPAANEPPFCLNYNLKFTTGLTVVTTSINTSDITVIYR